MKTKVVETERMNITLIGYRGSGKSSIAPLLSARLGWNWADVDRLIEVQANKTIKNIFAEDGEVVFRQFERNVVAELYQKKHQVIATGGGTILDAANRTDFKQAGPVIWLKASVEELFQRISKDPISAETRPNLTNKGGGIDEITEVLAIRNPLYAECATIELETADCTFVELVDIIFEQLPAEFTEGEHLP